jgi:Asp-tRNA(Asn)/Glu-tRNA(Gln) amidotransferase A subunit family amidase
MSPTRRDAIARLAALGALPLIDWPKLDGFSQARATDPLDGTIAAYRAGLVRRDYTVVETVRRALDRCNYQGRRWNAIDALSSDTALAEARAADQRIREGKSRGPLDGVPVFAKAIYDMKGLATSGSSAEWGRLFPEGVNRDSVEVARLRAAGAIVLGKTAADDFAYRGNGTSSHTGQVFNPYDPTAVKTPGGSSAGSAVAVAGGLAFCALGTDDGGSNRIPAQFTGVVGMKPTFGLVPRGGVIPTWPYLDTHGPLSRHVADAFEMLFAIAGPDASDPLAHPDSLPRIRREGFLRDDALKGVKLGLVELHAPRAQMTPEALEAWDRAVADLKLAGAIVEPFVPSSDRVNYRDQFTAAATARGDVAVNANSPAPTANALLAYFAGRTNDPRGAIKRGYAAFQSFYNVLPKTYEECAPLLDQPMKDDPAGRSFARSRAEVVAKLAASMAAAGVKAMVYPTMPFNAPRAVDPWPNVRTPLGYGNWLGLPEVSVPAGYGADGMPAMNLSIVGLPHTDLEVLRLAHAFERQSKRFKAPARVG